MGAGYTENMPNATSFSSKEKSAKKVARWSSFTLFE
jgi:hypothetical protein